MLNPQEEYRFQIECFHKRQAAKSQRKLFRKLPLIWHSEQYRDRLFIRLAIIGGIGGLMIACGGMYVIKLFLQGI